MKRIQSLVLVAFAVVSFLACTDNSGADAAGSQQLQLSVDGFVDITSLPIKYSKSGDRVNITWGRISGASNNIAMQTSEPLPVELRPLENLSFSVIVKNSGAYFMGRMDIQPSGIIRFYSSPDLGDFSEEDTKGVQGGAISYLL